MDIKNTIALINEIGDGDVVEKAKIILANRPENERLELLKDISNFMQYIGYAGETRVMSELLIRGIDALTSKIDNGFDITAKRGEEIFFVQVKTAFLDKENIFSFNVSTEDASAKYSGTYKVAYVFVLVSGNGETMDFLILPKSQLERQKASGNIWLDEGNKRNKIKIYLRSGKAFLGKVNNDASKFLNNWEFFTGEEENSEEKELV